jgi:AraC-like DNA-binding protein
MTFYHEQVLKIKSEIYPHDYLINQVIKAKQFIDVHYANNICLDEIAGEAFYSKFHFIRLFKASYGRTPYQYLTTVRISRAKELLQTGKSIQAVCISVGFESVSSFSGLFKKITGSAPSLYLNSRSNSTLQLQRK